MILLTTTSGYVLLHRKKPLVFAICMNKIILKSFSSKLYFSTIQQKSNYQEERRGIGIILFIYFNLLGETCQ